MTDIEAQQGVRPGIHGGLEYQFVRRAMQLGPPEIVNWHGMDQRAKIPRRRSVSGPWMCYKADIEDDFLRIAWDRQGEGTHLLT